MAEEQLYQMIATLQKGQSESQRDLGRIIHKQHDLWDHTTYLMQAVAEVNTKLSNHVLDVGAHGINEGRRQYDRYLKLLGWIWGAVMSIAALYIAWRKK